MTAHAATAKAIASGGLGSAFAFMLGDAEFIPLVIVGIFASTSSYFYDWVHRDPKAAGLKELSELIKYIFYGISVMFIVFYLCKSYLSTYVNLPISSFGFIAALCSASAVSIVEWASNILKIFINKKVSK